MKTKLNLNTRLAHWVGCMIIVSAVAACGGGVGDNGVPPVVDPVNNVNAVDDAFPSIQSAAGGSTTPVQLNDTVTINSTTTAAVLGTNATIAAVTRTSAAPAIGSITLNTSSGIVTIAAGTSAGAYAFSYQLCRTAPNQTVCDVATASGSVTSTPPASDIVTRADINACPVVGSPITTNNWSSCLAGKRVIGRDTFNSAQICELRFLTNGGVEYTHNGVTYVPEVNGPARSGVYGHQRGEQLIGFLTWDASVANPTIKLKGIDLLMRLVTVAGPSTLEVEYLDAAGATRVLNCAPNAL